MAKLKPWHQVVRPREDLRDNRPLGASEFAVHYDHIRMDPEDGVGKDARFWKLADNLNKLYPPGAGWKGYSHARKVWVYDGNAQEVVSSFSKDVHSAKESAGSEGESDLYLPLECKSPDAVHFYRKRSAARRPNDPEPEIKAPALRRLEQEIADHLGEHYSVEQVTVLDDSLNFFFLRRS